MDSNNWRPTTGQGPVGGIGGGGGAGAGEPTMEAGDWRTELQPEARQRIVSNIMDTLKSHLPVSGQDGLQELRKIAIRFEEKIFTAATSQGDYRRKISLKMLTMETKSQNPPANSLPNSTGNGNMPPDPGHHPSDEDDDSGDDEFYYHSQDEVSEEADGPPPPSSPDNSTGNYGQ